MAPVTVEYATYLPAKFLRDAGFETHIVSRGRQTYEKDVEGVHCWIEQGSAAASRRVLALRPEFMFVESSSYGALYGLVGRASWHRNPPPARRRASIALQRVALHAFDAISITNPAHEKWWNVKRSQRVDFPYPVDVAFWSEPVAKDPRVWASLGVDTPTGPVLVYVANLLRRKRQIELVDGLAPLLREQPDMRLVLVGNPFEEGVQEEILERRARQGVEAQVVLTGGMERDGIRQVLAWASLSVVHSEFETQLMTLYESLAARVPAVIPDIPELTSQFPQLLHHANDDQLRANVTRMLADDAARASQLEVVQPQLALADRRRHDELFYATVERLLGRSIT